MTKIEWTEKSWNPTVGCSKVSPGCDGCYAIDMAHRGMQPAHRGLTISQHGLRTDWTGEVRCLPDRLNAPLRRRKPTTWFVDSMSDLFHPDVPMEFILRVWSTMANAERHTFQVLTKRPKRMQKIVDSMLWDGAGPDEPWYAYVRPGLISIGDETDLDGGGEMPLDNVWLGTSIENDSYTFRADHLRLTPAAVRFLSLEPLLGPVPSLDLTNIDWVIVGGESGPGARPMHPDWARDIRDRCVDAGIPFFFKQWGEWVSPGQFDFAGWDDVEWNENGSTVEIDGSVSHCGAWPRTATAEGIWRVGKKRAGRLLDGRTWDEMPGEEVNKEDEWMPPPPLPRLGPCGICGWHPDQRHRVRDTIFGRLLAGEPVEDVAADYGWTPDEIMALHLDIDANLVDRSTTNRLFER